MDYAARRRWRYFETDSGRRPVREFIDTLNTQDRATIRQRMQKAARDEFPSKPLTATIHELKIAGTDQTFRLLFARQGRHDQILLALEAFSKKTTKTPRRSIALAERRLADWRARGKT